MLKRIRNNPYESFIKFLTIINIILFLVNIGLWLEAWRQHLFPYADFTTIYNTFVEIRSGYGKALSTINLTTIYNRGILGGLTYPGGYYPLQYPPFIALIFLPFSFLPFTIAFTIWTLGEIGIILWIIHSFSRLFPDWNKQERIFLTLALLAFFPLASTIIKGQFSLLLLFFLSQFYIAIRNNRQVKAGSWLAFMLIKPQTILLPGIIALNKRNWRVAASAAITALGLVFTSCLLYGVVPWINYGRLLLNMNISIEKYQFHPETEYTLRGLLYNIFGASQSTLNNVISNVILVLGIVIILGLWVRGIPPESPRFALRFAFTITLSVFLSLHLYEHDNLILVLPVVIVYEYLRSMGFKTKAYFALLLSSPFFFFISLFTSIRLFGIMRPSIVIILVLLAWMIQCMIRDYRAVQLEKKALAASTKLM